jgi:glycosyltransferase involved in cell wall biosynthesis
VTDAANTPTVSVIIPAYNAEAYVGQAISSALASRNVTLEVIVIDDGSTDGTWQVLESFGDAICKDRRQQGGPYRARNYGARLARGKWLAFLDADDDWLPDKLARQLAVADDETGLVYTDRLNFGDCSRVKERQSDGVSLWEGDVFERLLLGNFITLSSVLMHKRWFESLGGFAVEQSGVQDWDLWLRYAAAGGRIKLCREPLTRYRLHPEQMSNELGQRASDREAVLRRALALPRGRQLPRAIVRRAYAGVWEIAGWQAATSQRWQAVGWYLRAAGHWPWNLRLYKGIAKCCLGRM